MTRNWNEELMERTAFLRAALENAHAKGFILGNSGGKDCSLVGILARQVTENVKSVIMPCGSSRNFGIDRDHALLMAKQFDIDTVEVDVTPLKEQYVQSLAPVVDLSDQASMNINPRLRMITLYAMAQSLGYLVLGTGNRSEIHMGYFTKWGDGAYDVNPIADLTCTEVFDFLRFLGAPSAIIDKAPSAGLFEGQTDEMEMGISYAAIDRYLLTGEATPQDLQKITTAHDRTQHKRALPLRFPSQL